MSRRRIMTYAQEGGGSTQEPPNVLFVVDKNNGNFYAVDISNPSNLSTISTLAIGRSGLREIAIDQEKKLAFCILYYGSFPYRGRIISIDISNPSNMVIKQDLLLSARLTGGIAVDPSRNVGFIGSSYEGLVPFTYNSDGTGMVEYLGSGGNTSGASEVVLDTENNIAYLSSVFADNVAKIDISNINSLNTLAYSSGTDIDNARDLVFNPITGHIYVAANNSNSVYSLNASNLTTAKVITSQTDAFALDIDVDANLIFVSNENTGDIKSIDISNTSDPITLDTFSTGVTGIRKIVHDSVSKVLYVASNDNDGIVSVDTSNPSVLSTLDTVLNGVASRGLALAYIP